MRGLRQGDVLPASRQDIELRTSDGLTLVGELALPLENPPVATLICFHPLPTHGGSMDSHLLKKASFRLPHQAGLAVLRFNTRGTASQRGTSEGAFDHAEGERHDVAAALSFVDEESLPNVWLLGWSFGCDLVLRYGCVPAVQGAILLSPTLRWSRPEHLSSFASSGKPVTALVAEHDDFLPPDQAVEGFKTLPHVEIVVVEQAKHLLFGRAESILAEIVHQVVPAATQVCGPQPPIGRRSSIRPST